MQHVVGQNLSLGEKPKSSENQNAEKWPKDQNGFRVKVLCHLNTLIYTAPCCYFLLHSDVFENF